MLHPTLRRIIYTLTVLAWLVVIFAAFPVGDSIVTPNQRALAVLVAAIGSMKWLYRRMSSAPVDELYRHAKDAGRAEVLAESDPNVVSLAEHRDLRAVGGGVKLEGQPGQE